MELEALQTLVAKCQSIASTKERCQVFKECATPIKDLVAQIYDPFQKFHVTSKNIEKFEKKGGLTTDQPAESLSALLTALAEERITGHAALGACLAFIKKHPKYRDVILKALNKDLQIRVGVQLVNQAFPLLVPVFSCALSHPLEKHEAFYQKNADKFFISRKLDGCRCIFICENGKATAYSRSGHVFPAHIPGLLFFLNQFKNLTGVLDGEMGVVDEENKEYFNLSNSLMNPNAAEGKVGKKNLTLRPDQHMTYFAFDFIPLATFKHGSGDPNLVARQQLLKQHLGPLEGPRIRLLEQAPSSQMETLWATAENKGWEGLILRLNTKYEGKKSRSMLKRKQAADEEFVIEEATSSMQMPPGGTESELALEHVGITYKNNRVWVGSGFSWEQRQQYAQNPKELVGKHITVCYNGESMDKLGHFSLRHPRIKALYGAEGRQL